MATSKSTKPKKPNVLDISRVLKAVDQKNYDFYESLTPEEKKAFSPFILMRYTSSVKADPDFQEWFLDATNEMVNKDYLVISKNHLPLMWKLYAATGIGQTFYHSYLASGKKSKAVKVEKLLCELYPAMKMTDIQMLASMMDENDIKELFDKVGLDKAQRKEYE